MAIEMEESDKMPTKMEEWEKICPLFLFFPLKKEEKVAKRGRNSEKIYKIPQEKDKQNKKHQASNWLPARAIERARPNSTNISCNKQLANYPAFRMCVERLNCACGHG